MDIIDTVSISAYSNKYFMELKFSTRSVSVKMSSSGHSLYLSYWQLCYQNAAIIHQSLSFKEKMKKQEQEPVYKKYVFVTV